MGNKIYFAKVGVTSLKHIDFLKAKSRTYNYVVKLHILLQNEIKDVLAVNGSEFELLSNHFFRLLNSQAYCRFHLVLVVKTCTPATDIR